MDLGCRNEGLTFQPLLPLLQGLLSLLHSLFPQSKLGWSHRRRWSRFRRRPSKSHLRLLLLRDSMSQQAALENGLHGGPQIVLNTRERSDNGSHWDPRLAVTSANCVKMTRRCYFQYFKPLSWAFCWATCSVLQSIGRGFFCISPLWSSRPIPFGCKP